MFLNSETNQGGKSSISSENITPNLGFNVSPQVGVAMLLESICAKFCAKFLIRPILTPKCVQIPDWDLKLEKYGSHMTWLAQVMPKQFFPFRINLRFFDPKMLGKTFKVGNLPRPKVNLPCVKQGVPNMPPQKIYLPWPLTSDAKKTTPGYVIFEWVNIVYYFTRPMNVYIYIL